MNERRNLTIYADNCFFSSSFHGFFPEGMTVVAQRLWGRLALNRCFGTASLGPTGVVQVSRESYSWSPSHDQCGMLRPFGTSSAEWS